MKNPACLKSPAQGNPNDRKGMKVLVAIRGHEIQPFGGAEPLGHGQPIRLAKPVETWQLRPEADGERGQGPQSGRKSSIRRVLEGGVEPHVNAARCALNHVGVKVCVLSVGAPKAGPGPGAVGWLNARLSSAKGPALWSWPWGRGRSSGKDM